MPDLLSNKCFALCIIAMLFDNLDLTIATLSFQFKLLSITTPNNLVFYTMSISQLFMLILTLCSILQLVNSMKMVFDKFKDNLLTANHSLNLSSSLLTIILSWTMSLPEQKIFVSSAKRINFNAGETLQMSLRYSINNFGPSIELRLRLRHIYLTFESYSTASCY